MTNPSLAVEKNRFVTGMKVKEMNKKEIEDGTNLTRKKLVQARLPFQMISPRPEKLLARKRKLSKDDTICDDNNQVVKVICAGVKENCDLTKNSPTIKCSIKTRAAIPEVVLKSNKGTEGVAVEVSVEKIPDESEVQKNKESNVVGEVEICMNKQPEIKERDVKEPEFKEPEGRLSNEPDVKEFDVQLNKETDIKELQDRLETSESEVKEVEVRLNEEPDVRLYKESDVKEVEVLLNKEPDVRLNKVIDFKFDEVRFQEPGNSVDRTTQLAATESCSHLPASFTIAGCERLQDSCEESELLPAMPTNVKHNSPLDKRKAGPSPSGTTTPSKRLTPKQIQKQQESAKKKEEKELLKQEKEKKRVEEKEKKWRQKNEKEDQKKREREEKEKKRLAEVELKSEEKRKKDEMREEERRAKEEDKRRRDDARLVEEKRKEKAAMAFSSFFVAKKFEPRAAAMMLTVIAASGGTEEEVAEASLMSQSFMPFEVKADMRLAPLMRNQLSAERRHCLDTWLADPLSMPAPLSYLGCLKAAGYRPGRSGKTWPQEKDGDDVIIVETDTICGGGIDERAAESSSRGGGSRLRAKLLQFHQNRRPPYRGTWRKSSCIIRPTAPFNMDKALFEYDVDSDDEWEDEGEGESLRGSDDENEKESEDEYEVDNEVFVPHGYLSDEEAENEISYTSPEAQKAKLALLEEEFEAEMRFKTERIRPRVIGCIWIDESSMSTSNVGLHVTELFVARRAVWPEDLGPISTRSSSTLSVPLSATPLISGTLPASKGAKRRDFPDSSMESLIRLVHGNTHSRLFLVKEFTVHYYRQSKVDIGQGEDSTPSIAPPPISKRCVSEKIREIASWTVCTEKGPLSGRNCWLVSESMLDSHGLGALSAADNSWVYTLKSSHQQWRSPEPAERAEPAGDLPTISPRPTSHTITKFARVLTREERRRLLKPVITSNKSGMEEQLSAAVAVPVRKRVPLLMSVGRGVHIASSRQEAPTLAVSSTTSREKNSSMESDAIMRLLQNHNVSFKRITPVPVPRPPAPVSRPQQPLETVSRKPLDDTNCIIID